MTAHEPTKEGAVSSTIARELGEAPGAGAFAGDAVPDRTALGYVRRAWTSLCASAVMLLLVPSVVVCGAIVLWIDTSVGEADARRLRADTRMVAEMVAAAMATSDQSGFVENARSNATSALLASEILHRVEIRAEDGSVVADIARASQAETGASTRPDELDQDEFVAHASIRRYAGGRTNSVNGAVRVWAQTPEWRMKMHQRMVATGTAAAAVGIVLALVFVGAWAASIAWRIREVIRALRLMPPRLVERQANGAIRLGREPQWPIGPTAIAELYELESELPALWHRQVHSHREAESTLIERTAALVQANEALTESDARRRALVQQANELLEESRRRVAIELHDQTNASAISIRMGSSSLEKLLSAIALEDETRRKARDAITVIRRATDDLYESARNLIRQLRPEAIDTVGLGAALEDLVRSSGEQHISCHYDYDDHADLARIRGPFALAVFRIVQESINNIQKHASADVVRVDAWVEAPADVDVEGHSQPPGLILKVEVIDNGIGFDPTGATGTSLGLVGMRERAAALGGNLSIVSSPGQGTTVRLTAPVPADMLA